MYTKTIPIVLMVTIVSILVGCAESAQEPSAPIVDEMQQQPIRASTTLEYQVAQVDSKVHLPQGEVLTAKYSNLLALSSEEAAWLDRHGYPTPAEMDSLLAYDLEELSNATRNRRDSKAAALLGHRLLIDGDTSGALAAFSAGANMGSLYARQQLALVSTHSVTGLPMDKLEQADPGNLGVMVAQLEVARMLGDHRAQVLIDRYTEHAPWDNFGMQVLAQAAIFMDQYGHYARARGERIKGPDPRPNAAAWSKLQADADGLVEVYTRSQGYP